MTPTPRLGFSRWAVLRARLFFGWKTRTWPWRVPWQVVFISREPPSDADMERARQLSIERGWKDIQP